LLGTRALNRASASLHRAKQVSADTDEIAVRAMDELEDQGVQLVRTRNRVSGTCTNVKHAIDVQHSL